MKEHIPENFKNYSDFINFIEKHGISDITTYGVICFLIDYFGYVTQKTHAYISKAWTDGFMKGE